jgi:hypothetical protein
LAPVAYKNYFIKSPPYKAFPTAANRADRIAGPLSPLPCQALHGYGVSSAHHGEVRGWRRACEHTPPPAPPPLRRRRPHGYGNIYSKILRIGLFPGRSILRTSAARPRHSSGYDPPPACVASRPTRRGDLQRLTWLVNCQRTPFPSVASRLAAANFNTRRHLRSSRTLLAAKKLISCRSRPWTREYMRRIQPRK